MIDSGKTRGSKLVSQNKITSLKEYFKAGYIINYPWIFDKLVKDFEVAEVYRGRTNKMTDAGVKTSFKYLYMVGDFKSVVGIGFGKNKDKKIAKKKAIDDAKKNVIIVPHGCGSRFCNKNCNTRNRAPRHQSS